MIAINYALSEDEIQRAYDKLNSVDVLIEVIRNSIINHTSIQHEIEQKGK